ncbi:MAG: alanine dehydrogenase [Desulfobulbus propionicus]|nr:MAG: alanine dehydrogenase [Desulfobulbus propionicus]
MKTAIFGTSLKKNEKRIPIHPEHIREIPEDILKNLYFEEKYAEDFGFKIDSIKNIIGGILSRESLFKCCEVIVIPKICNEDIKYLYDDQIVYGWPHCVQGYEITQAAIDKKITLVAFEAMFSGKGDYKHHIFHKNNEIAGFASVQHATQVRGLTGIYGNKKKAIVFGFGNTARGAIYGLLSQGISDITVYTKRPPYLVQQQIPAVSYKQFVFQGGRAWLEGKRSFDTIISEADIIVNCVLQNPNKPIMFVDDIRIKKLKDNSLIIDVSCDENMGFEFAKPTTFKDPVFKIRKSNSYYYGIDHTPTIYWQTSSYEISRAILPFIKHISSGKNGYKNETILSNAVEIENGFIRNKAILKFQNREEGYPYSINK